MRRHKNKRSYRECDNISVSGCVDLVSAWLCMPGPLACVTVYLHVSVRTHSRFLHFNVKGRGVSQNAVAGSNSEMIFVSAPCHSHPAIACRGSNRNDVNRVSN